MGTGTEGKVISTEEMLKYFEDFDAIKFKYGYINDEQIHQDWGKYARIVKYEESNQHASLTKRSYGDFYGNLNLVYDEKILNQKNLRLLELVLDKVICQYINIDGIERLFSETYIEFEWEMHLSADYKKHNMKYYRDHFFHQIRNAYMMLVLMEEYGFFEQIKKVLLDTGESKVSRYVCRILEQQRYAMSEAIAGLRGKNEEDEENKENEIEFCTRNLIYMAALMAALFHDIGYPEAYYMQTSRHIMDYIVNFHELNSGNGNIKKVYSLLQNSLLFRVVSFEEIENRICNVKKPDHGALSAIVFLLHFYENGAIYKLTPYKTAAVELAALAIYNHTNAYEISDKKKINCDSYRPCFSLNPISYLLRICDDMQEWDRIYFVISNKSNPIFCNKCKTPILGKRERDNDENIIVRYKCNCNSERQGKEWDRFSRIFDGDSGFSYRRIYNVSVCDELRLSRYKINESFGNKEKLLIKLHYDPYKLLHVTYLNHTYAKSRIKELNSLKKFFANQREIPQIYLDYFVTSNPVHIKVEILERYLGNAEERGKKYIELIEKGNYAESIFNECVMEVFGECQCLISDFFDGRFDIGGSSCKILPYLEGAMKFYVKLYLCQIISKMNNMDYKKPVEDFVRHQGRCLSENLKKYPELQCLTEDCFLQFSKIYEFIPGMGCYSEKYYKQFENGARKKYLYPESEYWGEIESEDYYYVALAKYLDTQAYEPLLSRKKEIDYIDAYTDLYIFSRMRPEIKRKEAESKNG